MHERVAEAPGPLPRDDRIRRQQELPVDERVEPPAGRGVRGDRLHAAEVELRALDRRGLEQRAVGRVQQVEPRGEQRVQRRRERAGRARAR